MLPFSPNQHAVQPIKVTPQTLPFNPLVAIRVMPGTENWVPYLTAALINAFVERSGDNNIRIFTFNMMSQNGWNNQQFLSALEYFVDLYYLNVVVKRQISPQDQAAMIGLAEITAVQFVSLSLNSYQELRQFCTQPQLDSAFQQQHLLNSSAAEINSMKTQAGGAYQQPPQYQQPQFQQYQPPYQQQPPQYQQPAPGGGFPVQNRGIPFNSLGIGQQPSGPTNRFIEQSISRSQTTLSDSSLGNQPQSPSARPSEGGISSFSRFADFPIVEQNKVESQQLPVSDEAAKQSAKLALAWVPTAKIPYRTLVPKNVGKVEFYIENDNVVERIILTGENEMNRDQHTIVNIGGNYKLPKTRIEDLEAGIQRMTDTPAEALLRSETAGVGEAATRNLNLAVNTTDYAATSVDQSIIDGQIMFAVTKARGEATSVYRYFSTIAKPVICCSSYKPIIEELRTCRSFDDIADTLHRFTQAASMHPRCADESCVDGVMFCHFVDRYLTEVVNDFLKNKLSAVGVVMSSFISDASGLALWFNNNTKRYGPGYASAVRRFEADVIPRLFPEFKDTSTENRLNEFLSSDDGHSGIKIDSDCGLVINYIPAEYSFTYLDVLAEELSVEVKSHESLLIREDISPMLWAIASSLFKQKKIAKKSTLYDLLVTKDGEIFKLHEGYMGAEAYLISR